ncbi:MAG: hypothetical protein M1825_005074 [Sarcosagium campestre]|nr:MAG: hypothetical protein M1825_005074 [Sarcosagium campestre]
MRLLPTQKREYYQLSKKNVTLEEENAALKADDKAQRVAIATIKAELEKAEASTRPQEQIEPNTVATRVGAIPLCLENGKAKDRKIEGRKKAMVLQRLHERKRGAGDDVVMQ